MSERESEDERRFNRIAESAGWFQDKIMKTSRNSFPDRLYLKNGRFVLIEWKSDVGKCTPKQLLRHEELRKHGAEVYVTNSILAAMRMLGIRST